MTVHVLPVFGVKIHYDCPEVSTTSSAGIYRDLSPFVLGPIDTYIPGVQSQNFENLWQYAKVYKEHTVEGEPSTDYFTWRDKGWATQQAIRYPMGKGRKPEFSYWEGEKLGYIEARKQIYAAIYAEYVAKTDSYLHLRELYIRYHKITLKDYDAYDHIAMGMSLINVINNPDRKMGHAFVLAMLLEGKLEECIKS